MSFSFFDALFSFSVARGIRWLRAGRAFKKVLQYATLISQVRYWVPLSLGGIPSYGPPMGFAGTLPCKHGTYANNIHPGAWRLKCNSRMVPTCLHSASLAVALFHTFTMLARDLQGEPRVGPHHGSYLWRCVWCRTVALPSRR